VHHPHGLAAPPFGIGAADRRVGLYGIAEELIVAPGAELLRAEGPEGCSVLLQIARCRAPRDEHDLRDWQELARRMASSTRELIADGRVGILDHGITVENNGDQTVFWAMPWEDDLWRVGRAREHVTSVGHLVDMALVLTDLLARRHDAGWTEHLLSEDTIIAGIRTALVGAPIYIDNGWLLPDFEAPSFAPEEARRRFPTRMGDLWRLGRTLGVLASGFVLPAPFIHFIESLRHPDPLRRPTSARTALQRIMRIRADVRRNEETFADEEPTWVKLRAG
jgi:hypothetical protein